MFFTTTTCKRWLGATAAALMLAACTPEPDGPGAPQNQKTPTQPTDQKDLPPPFEAVSPSVYVAKVKYLLTGQPTTDEEIAAVLADRKALSGLIDTWMATPEFEGRMIEFFRNAFQQNQVLLDDLADTLPAGLGNNGTTRALLMRNIMDSYARTAWGIVSENRPFHETISTRRFMMTPPLLMVYSYMDMLHVNDQLRQTNRILAANTNFAFKVKSAGGAIPIEDTLNPASPNYMTFYNPTALPANATPECKVEPRVFNRITQSLYNYILGFLDNTNPCLQGFTVASQFAESEFNNWRWVNLRQIQAGEQAPMFYDLKTMREASEIPVRVPRVGFFSTPAFHANWATNSSNQARVTMNQVLIVALGKSFDGTNNTTPIKEPALDAVHASNPDCYTCHQTLDPMRQAFRQAYSLAYHEQTDTAQMNLKGVFAFGGVTKEVSNLDDLAQTMATHPRFALAWTSKLCNWANSSPCLESDPEVARVAAEFQKSNYNWKSLVRTLFSSPLVTAAADTKTFQELGVTLSIARRDQFCGALGTRLGIVDPCGQTSLRLAGVQGANRGFSALVPADGYSRGAEASTLANDPNLFFRAAVEDICVTFAGAVVDPAAPAINRFPSAKAEESMDLMVRQVMSLTSSDKRLTQARAILGQHFAEARASGATAADALRSTFTLACLSPSSVGVGL